MTRCVGQAIQDFSVVDVRTGESKKLFDYLAPDKPTVIDFFTTWWPSCPGSCDKLEASSTQGSFAGKVNFLLIGIDDQIAPVKEQGEEKGWKNCPLLWVDAAAQKTISSFYELKYIPHTVLLNKDKVVVRNYDFKIDSHANQLTELL